MKKTWQQNQRATSHGKPVVREEANHDRFIPINTKTKAAASLRSTHEPSRGGRGHEAR